MVERAESDEADDEKLVSIVRTADTTHARALVALLESKGIWSHAQGLEDATLGALGIVRVRAKDARSARKLLRSLERGKPLRPLGDEDVDAPTYRGSARVRAEPEAEPTELVRLKRVATMVSIVIPGGGHLYVRRYPPVLALWFLYFVVIYAALHGVRGAASLGFVVMFADALGASWAAISRRVVRSKGARGASQCPSPACSRCWASTRCGEVRAGRRTAERASLLHFAPARGEPRHVRASCAAWKRYDSS